MHENTLLDNDVMIKSCCYALAEEVCDLLAGTGGSAAALGVTRFIVAKQIARKPRIVDKKAAGEQFAKLCDRISFIEPTEEEICLAAEVEAEAQAHDLELDGGESQLLAVLALRSAKLMLTGDKRAIVAIEKLICEHGHVQACSGQIACLEQLIMTLITRHGLGYVRSRVCCEPKADQGLAICFSCTAMNTNPDSIKEGLVSYIRDLRGRAPTALCSTDDLSF